MAVRYCTGLEGLMCSVDGVMYRWLQFPVVHESCINSYAEVDKIMPLKLYNF